MKSIYYFLIILSISLSFSPAAKADISAPCAPSQFKSLYFPKRPSFTTQINNMFYSFYEDVEHDYFTYYTGENLLYFGGTLFIAGISANSKFDRRFNHYYQTKIRTENKNRFLHPFIYVGFYSYLRIYGSIYLLGQVGNWTDTSAIGYSIYQWGYRSLRAWLIASPQITLLRKILGGGRPYSKVYTGSKWRLFKEGRASCSGHTFNGALPFLTAAMMSDDPLFRYGFYALSTLPGLARLNYEKHYISQIFIGWTLAFLAAKTVDESDYEQSKDVKLSIIPFKQGFLCNAHIRW